MDRIDDFQKVCVSGVDRTYDTKKCGSEVHRLDDFEKISGSVWIGLIVFKKFVNHRLIKTMTKNVDQKWIGTMTLKKSLYQKWIGLMSLKKSAGQKLIRLMMLKKSVDEEWIGLMIFKKFVDRKWINLMT